MSVRWSTMADWPDACSGTHVPHGSHDVTRPGQRRVRLAEGQSEVGDPQFALGIQQKVGRLDVAVDDAVLVGGVQRLGRLDAKPHRSAAVFLPFFRLGREEGNARGGAIADLGRFGHLAVQRGLDRVDGVGGRGAGGGPPRPTQLRQRPIERLAVDELHGVEMDAPLHADRIHGNDMGVVQLCRGLRFVLEAGDPARVQHRREGEHFQGDAPVQRDLVGLVHHAHAAPADLADEAEIAQPLFARHRRPRLRRTRGPVEPRRHLVQVFQAVEIGAQRPGQVGIGRQELLAGQRHAFLHRGEIAIEGLRQAILLLGRHLPQGGRFQAQIGR